MNNESKGMINVSQMVHQVAQQARDGVYEDRSTSCAPEDFINSICAKLRAITKGYRQKMVDAGGEVVYKRQLMLALAENELTTDALIEPALNYYRNVQNDKEGWCPTPAQFVGACKTRHVDGCPTAKQAYLEYVQNYAKSNHQWSHEIVRAAVRLSKQGYEIKSLPEEKAFLIYERAYQILMDRIIKGEPLDVPIPKALPTEACGRTTTPKENVSHMASMRASLNI